MAGCLLFVMESSAQNRDPDGTRMQARKVNVGSTQSATLSPPQDAVDWRYIQLKEGAEVSIEVSSEPASVPVRLVLTSATGDELASASSQGGRVKVTQRLDSGIYYFSIGSSNDVSYRVSVR
ncbi:MAG: hypothetical protein ACNA8W_07915 [Bradymonadaceae bacterium]